MRRISAKKLNSLGGVVPFSTIPSSSKKRIRKKPRSTSEFARIYGSKERVEFVKSLNCAACGVVGFSENAHVAPPSEKGTGYKADAKWIVPLCGTHEEYEEFFGEMRIRMGCHKLHDEYPITFAARFPSFNAQEEAARTEKLWLASQGEE